MILQPPKIIIEIGKYNGQFVVLRDLKLITAGHSTLNAAKQAGKETVNFPPGYRFTWLPGAFHPNHEPGVEILFYHVYDGKVKR